MKKLLILTSVLSLSTVVFADFQDPERQGGFQSPSAHTPQKITTVAKAKRAADESDVALSGYITAKVGDEKYTFKDASGSIQVEIDDDKWQGLNVSPKTKVRLYGKVDKDNAKTEIDVKRISK